MSENIKHLIRELIDDVIDEMTTSGAAGPYMSKGCVPWAPQQRCSGTSVDAGWQGGGQGCHR